MPVNPGSSARARRACWRAVLGAAWILATSAGSPSALAQTRAVPDSLARADSAAARSAANDSLALPDSLAAAPARPDSLVPAPARPVRTRTRRGGPYNVVADRLEGGRSTTEGEILMLIGNVTLSRAGTVVTSQLGRYVKREGTIYLSGGVRAVDGRTTITALDAAYNETSDL